MIEDWGENGTRGPIFFCELIPLQNDVKTRIMKPIKRPGTSNAGSFEGVCTIDVKGDYITWQA